MDRTKDGVARQLAEAHFRVEPEIRQIFRLLAPDSVEADDKEPVKLLEVNPSTPKTGIMPVYFAADPASGVFYSSIIVEIHPEEMADVKRNVIRLPNDWRIGPEFHRPHEMVPA